MTVPYQDFFDDGFPRVTEIRARYGDRCLDLNAYHSFTHADVVDAICTVGSGSRKYGYLIIPPDYQFWDQSAVFRKSHGSRRIEVPLTTATRFRRYGDDVNLTRSGTTVSELKEGEITPRKALAVQLASEDVKEGLRNGRYKGFGWWDARKPTHRPVSWSALPVGQKFYDQYGKRMNIEYQYKDCRITVPSWSRNIATPSWGWNPNRYIFTLRVLPVTERDREYFTEWTMTEGSCGCEDVSYRGARGRIMEDREIQDVFKYANPESPMCWHFIGAYRAAAEASRRTDNIPTFLVDFPEATGLLGPWYALKTKTIVGTQSRARRPLITEIDAELGRVVGHMDHTRLLGLED